jgi:hypothetical protein
VYVRVIGSWMTNPSSAIVAIKRATTLLCNPVHRARSLTDHCGRSGVKAQRSVKARRTA